MRPHNIFTLVLACLSIHTFTSAGLVALHARSPGQSFTEGSSQNKRQPSTPQQQAGLVKNVPAPGLPSQNVSSTAGAGDGTNPVPGVITNGPTAAASDGVDCNNVTTGRDNRCWAELNLTQWTERWVEDNSCHTDEPFASCFLRMEGFPGLDCTGIKISACTAPQGDNLLKEPEVFYVAYNIYAINQFFLSWWTAVGAASSMASDNVGAIVQLLDPLSSFNTDLDAILITLTGLFALVPGLGYLADGVMSQGWIAFATVMENALFAMPQIGRWLFPIDSATSQVVQMSALSSEMATIIQTVQNNLNKTLVSVMANTSEFLAFASQGNFSESAPSLPDQTNYLLYAFNTYVISQALNGNNVYGVYGQDTDPQALATNGSRTPYDLLDCKSGYNEQGVCDTWWYSTRYSSAFGLDDFSHMNRGYGDVLTSLFSNYTTGEFLFEGAYTCNANGNYGQPVNVTVNAAGVTTGCLSRLRIVTWDMSCDDPEKHSSNGCEFLEIPRQNTFFASCGSQSAYSVMDDPIYCVPASYLGPLIAQNHIQLKR